MSINWIYKDDRKVFSNVERGGVPYLSFKALEDTDGDKRFLHPPGRGQQGRFAP